MSSTATAPLLTAPASTGLRLLPAPVSEPPYDDEGGASLPALRRTAPALRLVPPPVPEVAPAPVPAEYPAESPAEAPEPAQQRTEREALPSPRPFARALVQRLLETAAGARPVTQLQPDTTPALFERLEPLLHARRQPGALRPSLRAVRSLHVQEQPGSVVEVCATVERGPRLVALALRLEGIAGRWCCTEVVGI